ncbi:hypothetical protein RYH80_12175 [Halobaculum sp. MBLA0147]|uniref:hypothetical protein n=1 Tax=Halobaculum sp. MBLA0147 TaxID=3079934 RepID=UPI0035236A9A
MNEETTESTNDAVPESASTSGDATDTESASAAADSSETESTPPDAADASTRTTESPEAGPGTADSSEASSTADTGRGVLGDTFGRWVNYLLLAGLSLVVLIAGFRVYLAVDALIRRFVASEFQQVFYGVFNLALLLLAVAGILVQRRRMR